MLKKEHSRIQETVSRCWCSKTKHRFGLVLISNESDTWELRHSYSVNESYSEAECRVETITGAISVSPAYNGCKWCSNTEIFQCGECKALNCQGAKKRNKVLCAKCGTELRLHGQITSLSVSRD